MWLVAQRRDNRSVAVFEQGADMHLTLNRSSAQHTAPRRSFGPSGVNWLRFGSCLGPGPNRDFLSFTPVLPLHRQLIAGQSPRPDGSSSGPRSSMLRCGDAEGLPCLRVSACISNATIQNLTFCLKCLESVNELTARLAFLYQGAAKLLAR